jgi:hypothetical protein
MKPASYLAVGIILGAFAVSAAGRVRTQDPVEVAPRYNVVRFENDRVRVLELHMKPGEKETMHSHPPHVVYVLTEFTMRNVLPDGTQSEASRKAGDVFWRDATTHSAANVGATEARAIAIELKPCTR